MEQHSYFDVETTTEFEVVWNGTLDRLGFCPRLTVWRSRLEDADAAPVHGSRTDDNRNRLEVA